MRTTPPRFLLALALAALLAPSVAGAAPDAAPQSQAPAGAGAAVCGNGLLEAGETCASCPADCTVHPCGATTKGPTVVVSLSRAPDAKVLGLTVVLGYRNDRVSLPGSGTDNQARTRIKDTPRDAVVASVDRDYALRVVIARGDEIPTGPLFTVEFDACSATDKVSGADFACAVEGCANVFGPVQDCTCSAVLR
jgi:hypothetical protein